MEESILRWKAFTFTYMAKQDLQLPPFKGATLRGSFGLTFKHVVCPTPGTECKECRLRENCPYFYVFDTPVKEDSAVMRKYTNAPHPFIIEPPEDERTLIGKGETITFRLILIGHAIEYLPHFIYTFMRAGELGIGRGRRHADLVKVVVDGENILNDKKISPFTFETNTLTLHTQQSKASACYNVHLRLPFPVRIEKNSKLWGSDIEPSFGAMMRNLLRRITLLAYFHCNGTPQYPFKDILPLLNDVKTKSWDLKAKTIARFSRRQHKKTPLRGVIGTVNYEHVPEIFIKYLQVAEDIHVGKNTSFGFGKVILEEVSMFP